jgi:hypothetical protein
MPLPEFREDGWLPEGHHPTTWAEIEARFGGEPGTRRRGVLENLLRWRDRLRERGIGGRLILNGSFVSAKPDPGDFDTLLIGDDGAEQILAVDDDARQLIDYGYCKSNRWGDVFFFSAAAVRRFPSLCRTDVFDFDKATWTPKGVVEVEL